MIGLLVIFLSVLALLTMVGIVLVAREVKRAGDIYEKWRQEHTCP